MAEDSTSMARIYEPHEHGVTALHVRQPDWGDNRRLRLFERQVNPQHVARALEGVLATSSSVGVEGNVQPRRARSGRGYEGVDALGALPVCGQAVGPASTVIFVAQIVATRKVPGVLEQASVAHVFRADIDRRRH